MQLPIVKPAPIVQAHARVFRHLFEKQKKERQKLHKLLDKKLLEDPEFQELHSQFKTKIALAIELIEQARNRKLPFTTVLMDSWYLAPALVAALKEHQLDWVSLLKKNRS